MSLPAARPAGSDCELKIVAAAALVPGQVMSAFGGYAGIVQGTQNIAIGEPAVLALKGKWEIDCATGTTASAGDNAYFNTSTNLVVTAGGANIIWIGVFAHAKTSGQLKATINLNADSFPTSPWVPSGAIQALSGAGAVNVTSYLTNFTSTGAAQALTLAAGVRVGQLKKIKHIVDGGSGVLTPVAITGGTTITFTSIGEFAILQWNGAAWVMIDSGNDVGGASLPALA
jgi:hypothetical protein